MVLLVQAAVTPVGNPVAVPIPVAPVVVCVIFVKEEFMQRVGVDEGVLAVLFVFVKQKDKPPAVAAYTELPTAKTPKTPLLPKPFEVDLFVKLAPPSVDILKPPLLAAYTELPTA